MGFPRYEAYKDSGVEWLGEVPEHWSAIRLKHCLAEPLSYGANEAPDGTDPDHPRYIRITDLDESGTLKENSYKSLSPVTAAPYMLEDGDVLLARSGATVGKSFLYSKSLGPCCYAGYLIRARPIKATLNSYFLWMCTLSSHYKKFIASSTIQATIQNVSAEKYNDFWLALPGQDEQNKIVDFLDRETTRIDALIVEQQRLIELLKEKRQAVISHAVTKGLDPTVPMKDSCVEWLGEVPAHWKVMKLARAMKGIEQGWSPNASNEPAELGEWGIIKISSIKKGLFFEGENKSILKETIPDPSIEVKHKDLLVTRANTPDLVGDACVVKTQPCAHLMLSDLTYRLRPEKNIEPEFICFFLVSSVGRAQIKGDARGSSMSMAKISQGHIKSWSIALPEHKEQLEICSSISEELRKIDCLIQESLEAKQLLQERRSALISAAVTGKIDVRNASAPASA